MASATEMNQALRTKLIELQGWTLVLLLCFSCLLGGVYPQELPKKEVDALQAVKRAWSTSTPDFDTRFQTWSRSPPQCEYLNYSVDVGGWVGVWCDVNSDGATVTSLMLVGGELVGVLPSEVSNLSSLEHINLWATTGLYGPIPKGVVQLRNLSGLALDGNKFSGGFPFSSIVNGSQLSMIRISRNEFNGTIGEDAFQNLAELRLLDLSYNMFSGEFPFRSINGSKFSWLYISSNQFNGTVGEDTFRNLGQLQELDLSNNMFNGEFPFGSIIIGSILQRFNISNNRFNGTIKKDAFQNLGQLEALDLSSNVFTSQAPSVSKMKMLQYLYLDSNKFTGQAPDVSNLVLLNYLNMSRNKFEGQTPNLSGLEKLINLDLSKNKFSGEAPDVSKMSQLEYLDLSQNGFIGQAPNVSNLTLLRNLDLSQNNFKGHLPTFSINASLWHINLSSNHFTELSSDLLSFLNNLRGPINKLDLSSVQVGGGLVPHFVDLNLPVSLSELYLDKNNFTGILNVSAILKSNASKTLKVLSLKDNMITNVNGHDSSIISFANGLTKILLHGNPYCKKTWTSQDETKTCNFYCGNTCSKPKLPKKDQSILIMASSISSVVGLVMFLVIVRFGFVLHGKEKYIQDLQKKIKVADVNAKKFDYNELRIATKNFAPEMKLGEGGYGAVFKGILAGNVVVAVKQLLLNTNASKEDFVNEVLLISNLQHQNLVSLKGYCLNDKRTLLVYEYVDNCDLDKLLLSHQATTESTSQGLQLWKTRLNICQGVAQGLHYLHTFSHSRIIHRDIKASNILINKNFEAKIADFGLARLILGSVIETSRCAGTFGYLAPEYASEGELSEKADIYSFGVLLLEIVSGMRNQDQRMPENEMHLAIWAWKLHQMNRLLDMKDPMLIVNKDEIKEIQRVLETAVLCVQNNPKKRPAMVTVAAMLAGKANGDKFPPIDEELEDLSMELALEESDYDVSPLFNSTASALVSLASRPTYNP